jgi:hypothetical protein
MVVDNISLFSFFSIRSSNPRLSLIVERQDTKLKLFSAPNYHPSFQKGLHFANIVAVVHGVNKVWTIELNHKI